MRVKVLSDLQYGRMICSSSIFRNHLLLRIIISCFWSRMH